MIRLIQLSATDKTTTGGMWQGDLPIYWWQGNLPIYWWQGRSRIYWWQGHYVFIPL